MLLCLNSYSFKCLELVSIIQRKQQFNPDPLSPGTLNLFLKAGTYECLLNSISYSKNSKKLIIEGFWEMFSCWTLKSVLLLKLTV